MKISKRYPIFRLELFQRTGHISKERIVEVFYDATKTWFEGKVDPPVDLQAEITIKRHPRPPHSQMVVQQAPADRHIPFLRIMVLLVASNLLVIHNKFMVLNPNWKFQALGA